MISLKNSGQIAKMREAGRILREVEDEVRHQSLAIISFCPLASLVP